MSNPLSKKFTFWSLLSFAAPTIAMMVLMSLYTMVDGVFVARFVNTNALSAINIVYPLVGLIIGIAVMLATGGSAVIATKMGAGKRTEAKENFSLIVLTGAIVGIVVAIVGLIFLKPLISLLGASTALYDYCEQYLFVLLFFTPCAILQMLFQFFFVTAGKPNYGLIVTVAGGLANVVLDYVFIVPMGMGIAGAALATGIGYSIPAVAGLIYFAYHQKATLHFVKPKFDAKALFDSCTNGSSEMVTNLATSVTTLLFNLAMMRYVGEDGVAAITIVLYAQFLLTAVYLGFSSGVAPIFSYNHGNDNRQEVKKLFRTSTIFIGLSSVMIFGLSIVFSVPIVLIFAPKGSAVFELAINGFLLFSISYLLTGANIFASSMFTAFSNGRISATISFLRTFVFIILAITVLPIWLEINGIWLAVPFAEGLTLVFSLGYICKYRKVYHY